MNAQLHAILAQQRVADLQRAAEHARLATDAATRRRDSRESYPIVRALPMPTAHPSPEAWPATSLPAGMGPTPARTRGRRAFVPGHGDELRSRAFSLPQKSPAAVERSAQLTRLVYELLDAHADTEHLSRTQHSEPLWHAHLRYLRDLQRVAREVLADVS